MRDELSSIEVAPRVNMRKGLVARGRCDGNGGGEECVGTGANAVDKNSCLSVAVRS